MRVTVPRNPGTVAGVAMAVFLALRIPRAHCRDAPKLGRVCAETWNTQKDLLAEFRAYVETLCRHNYKETASFTVQRRVEPTVTVSPASTEAPNHHNLLVCSVTNFYPRQVKVKWFRNQQEETAGVGFTPLTQNGDWTYQIHVMLETIPQLGDVYVCRVDHPSLQSPVTVEWRKGRFIDPMDSTGKEKFRECAASGGVGSVFIPRVLRNSLTQILGWR